MKQSIKRSSLALVALILLALAGTSPYSPGQTQNQAAGSVRSRADETLEWRNQIGNKLIAMAKDFPEDKYDFKVQQDERTFAQNLLHVAAVDYDLIGSFRIEPQLRLRQGQTQPVARPLQDESRRSEAA
jgi:uncharacterized damage-inducible protein DinB